MEHNSERTEEQPSLLRQFWAEQDAQPTQPRGVWPQDADLTPPKQAEAGHDDPSKQINKHKVLAVLSELQEALDRLAQTGETYSVFLNTTGLQEVEQVDLLQELGEGDITIDFKNTDEPVSWYETLYRGIWIGAFRNHRGETTLRTIEVCRFPEIASAQPEDSSHSAQELADKIADKGAALS